MALFFRWSCRTENCNFASSVKDPLCIIFKYQWLRKRPISWIFTGVAISSEVRTIAMLVMMLGSKLQKYYAVSGKGPFKFNGEWFRSYLHPSHRSSFHLSLVYIYLFPPSFPIPFICPRNALRYRRTKSKERKT